ncbi:hypothetical protein J6590_029701 [Homalodisca vitripennis]|nr:hypothetical protein J6590_029701 [Homalodisca vitripennis]
MKKRAFIVAAITERCSNKGSTAATVSDKDANDMTVDHRQLFRETRAVRQCVVKPTSSPSASLDFESLDKGVRLRAFTGPDRPNYLVVYGGCSRPVSHSRLPDILREFHTRRDSSVDRTDDTIDGSCVCFCVRPVGRTNSVNVIVEPLPIGLGLNNCISVDPWSRLSIPEGRKLFLVRDLQLSHPINKVAPLLPSKPYPSRYPSILESSITAQELGCPGALPILTPFSTERGRQYLLTLEERWQMTLMKDEEWKMGSFIPNLFLPPTAFSEEVTRYNITWTLGKTTNTYSSLRKRELKTNRAENVKSELKFPSSINKNSGL